MERKGGLERGRGRGDGRKEERMKGGRDGN